MAIFLHEFLKYKDGSVKENGWWEIVGDKLFNMNGGWHNYTPNANDEIVEADDFDDLFNKVDTSYLLKPNSPFGWVDPNGIFYGCDRYGHNTLAALYFKSDERELEEKGYVKIYRSYNGTIGYYVEDYLTEAQVNTLKEKQIKVNPYDTKEWTDD